MAGTIIIGGGAVGLSVAYHLAKRGVEDIVLLERNQLTSGTSWHAAGIVGPLRATPNMTKLAMYAGELFPKLEAETGMHTGYKVTGGYWLARRPERMDELNRIAALGKHFGLTPKILNPDELAAETPFLDVSNHAGAMSVAEDANVNPVDLCMAYARAAKNLGVTIKEGVAVAEICSNDARVAGVKLLDGAIMEADNVVTCAGAWSKPLAASAGLELPLQAVEHMYVVTEPIEGLPDPFPVLRDLETGIYIKGDAGGKLVIGGFEPDAKCWDAFGPEGDRAFLEMPEDWDQFTPFMEAALELMPALETAGIQRFMNGPESFTADTKPLIGEAPHTDGLFVAAGMNSVGIMSSAGIGRVLADWIADGIPPMDLWEVDIARVDPATASDSHMAERMKEAVSDQFTMHWPFKQPKAGRNLRKSALHEQWAEQGAVFGLTAGWERGLWYAQSENERDLPYSVGKQHWQALAEREAAEMEDGAVLLDLSPFAKFDVAGSDALSFMQNITCQNMDRPIGSVSYAPLLNENGGIEADVTVSRLEENHFRITSGAAIRWREAARLKRQSRDFSVSITDCTEDEVAIGIMGAKARETLASLSDDNWDEFPFSSRRQVTVSSVQLAATRVSFVGELGWELSIAVSDAPKIFDALIQAGAKPMGHYALDACRVEKGFYHWGHDLGPEITPLECGLGWIVDWSKEFLGKSALQEQRDKGVRQRLCLFNIEGHPLMLHDEPIWENGNVVGLTTSGGKGARTGLTLAFGLVEVAPGENITQTCQRQFTIEIAGEFYNATALKEAPYDPKGERMRA
ncbi:MAG: FAD-dependent oxidoreductase [Pseudomonadota bacterium]